ncbi:fibronectin type III domain-containing protein [uncultured Alistipes sp.]|mgnify:CR=1 FL=1|uniref:fibronectin type III domain-containing protein n=1 Tax=uncultured Alistipes sp. TaxID=538949 RepID=UPI0026065295|nr:fibronectin type III domain-containing protein [uncultured Alistipes sp.]
MKNFFVLFSVALIAMFLTGCHKSEPYPEMHLPASIAIEEVKPTKHEVTFMLTSTNAVRMSYCCLPKGTTPTEKGWTELVNETSAQITVKDLEPGTAYTLRARAENQWSEMSEIVTRDFETLRLPSLELGVISATADGAEVAVKTADAQHLFWACVPASEKDPSEFTETEALSETTLKVAGLTADTEYRICAYVSDADSRSDLTSKTFRTEAPASIDLSAGGTANCYVVSEPGVYSFTADVRGNGVSSNNDAESKHFESSIAVGADWSADWLWATAEGLVSNVVFDAASKRIRFEASAGRGNVILALFDAEQQLVWSWHIWMTDDPSLQLVGGSSPEYQFLDRNVGATSTAVDDVASFGFFYQWGRKDPFIAASALINPDGAAIPDGDAFQTAMEGSCIFNMAHTIGWETLRNDAAVIEIGKSVEYAAAHPMTFITYGAQLGSSGVGAWVNDDNVQYAELWGYDFVNHTNRKTMFDPCPPGYKVPAWYQEVMADADKTTMVETGQYQSRTYNGGYWPAQGYRTDQGRLSNVGRYGYYWSACSYNHGYPAQNFKGYMLYWYSRMVSNNNAQNEAIGGNIRCIRE